MWRCQPFRLLFALLVIQAVSILSGKEKTLKIFHEKLTHLHWQNVTYTYKTRLLLKPDKKYRTVTSLSNNNRKQVTLQPLHVINVYLSGLGIFFFSLAFLIVKAITMNFSEDDWVYSISPPSLSSIGVLSTDIYFRTYTNGNTKRERDWNWYSYRMGSSKNTHTDT